MTDTAREESLQDVLSSYRKWLIDDYTDLDAVINQWSDGEPHLVAMPGCATSCSTSQVLIPYRPPFAWDVNGWYRQIGIEWPYVHATDGQLSKSYLATGGQSSARATYCLKRLLHKPSRLAYDRAPLGREFLDDDLVQDRIRAQMNAERARRQAAGEVELTVEDVFREHGMDLGPDPAEVDFSPFDQQEETEAEDWPYGYWLWGSDAEHARCIDMMRSWQQLLVANLAKAGVVARIGVGVSSGAVTHERTTVRCVEKIVVVFLREDVYPNPDDLRKAVTSVKKHFSLN